MGGDDRSALAAFVEVRRTPKMLIGGRHETIASSNLAVLITEWRSVYDALGGSLGLHEATLPSWCCATVSDARRPPPER